MNLTKTLTYWYSINKRELPWRKTKNPYYVWLSEIILQQTQVKQGLPYFEAFVAHYPTVFQLANADESDVLKLWEGLGYYSRARNLHTTAKFIANDLNGEFPDNYNDLLKLKGIGDYTASAIASICFNQKTAVVDGNVFRVLSRYYGIDTPINTTLGFKTFKALAQDLLDKQNPADFNQAIMEFGAIQCKPNNPDCSICPLQTNCIAFRNKKITLLPVKLKQQKPKKKYFNFLVYTNPEGETVLEKRKGKGIWQNLYQFPLIETNKSYNLNEFKSLYKNQEAKNFSYNSLTLFNESDIVHKLSHQHLYTKFWIISTNTFPPNSIVVKNTNDYPVPVVIKNFLSAFNF